ncbi:prepilin-type N-terminal cleavage/methylation domain-containing protein [Candidatus Kaiserbacteria bacterium]|nr:prepilin-type N-terminal cleavage/methylation domain-containing protein [Candidatus Kaiserbacteria bacterium]
MIRFTNFKGGFTLIELLVTVAIIGILSSIVYGSFGGARAQARDDIRRSDLKELQLAVELYKAQTGSYPTQGCGSSSNDSSWAGPGPGSSSFNSCSDYIVGLVPDYIAKLPTDPKSENENSKGFYYNTDGVSYKIMVHDSVEKKTISSNTDEFARCPTSTCGGILTNTYAVYSFGAEDW